MPVLKDRHVVISRARNGREIYDTVCEWLNTTNYFKWTDDSVSYNNELEELDRKRRMLLLRFLQYLPHLPLLHPIPPSHLILPTLPPP